MTSIMLLKKLGVLVYGSLIFLLVIGVLFTVYQIFWKEELTIPEQNLESVFSEIKELQKDSCFEVAVRPCNKYYGLLLYPNDNSVEQCHGKPCLCVHQDGVPLKCRSLSGEKIESKTSAWFEAGYYHPVKVCNNNEKLSISLV